MPYYLTPQPFRTLVAIPGYPQRCLQKQRRSGERSSQAACFMMPGNSSFFVFQQICASRANPPPCRKLPCPSQRPLIASEHVERIVRSRSAARRLRAVTSSCQTMCVLARSDVVGCSRSGRRGAGGQLQPVPWPLAREPAASNSDVLNQDSPF